MRLGELIDLLSQQSDPQRVLARGFANPHAYRGYYDQLAFEPASGVTIAAMLADARASVGRWFVGYKGGDYRMELDTTVWLAHWGECGDEDPLSAADVGAMLATAKGAPVVTASDPSGTPRDRAIAAVSRALEDAHAAAFVTPVDVYSDFAAAAVDALLASPDILREPAGQGEVTCPACGVRICLCGDCQPHARGTATPAEPCEHIAAEEPGILWMSMRYALGRATYAVGEVCDAITRHAGSLSPAQRRRMAGEIRQAIDADAAGMDMDVERWERAEAVLLDGNTTPTP